jgi:hypothetical protein
MPESRLSMGFLFVLFLLGHALLFGPRSLVLRFPLEQIVF